MKLSKNELKKIQYDFNRISNRLLKADINDYSNVLKRFVDFIESNDVIFDFIIGCGETTLNWAVEVAQVQSDYGAYFELGDTDDEETSNVYALLKYVVENNIDVPRSLSMAYSSSNKYVDKLKGFNERVAYVLIQHVEGYLTKVGYDMGLDENQAYNITNNNGQVNIAMDNAAIKAEQNIGIDTSKLSSLIEGVLQNITTLSSEDQEAVKESVEVINQEATSSMPKKSFLKAAKSTLKGIKGTAEFGAAVAALISFIQQLL